MKGGAYSANKQTPANRISPMIGCHDDARLTSTFSTPAGHARVNCAFDVLFRLLQHLNYEVFYVRNFTDIDDKIIKRAAETGEDPLQLSSR